MTHCQLRLAAGRTPSWRTEELRVATGEQLTCGAIDWSLRRAGTWKHDDTRFQATATQRTGFLEDEITSARARAQRAEISRDVRNRGGKRARGAHPAETRDR